MADIDAAGERSVADAPPLAEPLAPVEPPPPADAPRECECTPAAAPSLDAPLVEPADPVGETRKRAREDVSDAQNAEWAAMVTDPAARAAALGGARGTVVAASGADAKGERELLLARAFAHPRDARIKFVEETHSYILDGHKVGISVSGLWSRYFGHFNAAGALRNLEKWRANEAGPYYGLLRHLDAAGVPRDEQAALVQRTWTANGLSASEAGTFMHRQIELCLNEEPHAGDAPGAGVPRWRRDKRGPLYNLLMYLTLVERAPREQQLAAAKAARPPRMTEADVEALFEEEPAPPANPEFAQWRRWRAARPELLPVRTEMNVFAAELNLAGQLDGLFYDTAKQEFVIADWKRCQEIGKDSFGNKMGKPPFDNMTDSTYSHYAAQQNLYCALLRHWYGVNVARLMLVQLHPDLETYAEHEVPILVEATDRVLVERAREVGSDWAPAESDI